MPLTTVSLNLCTTSFLALYDTTCLEYCNSAGDVMLCSRCLLNSFRYKVCLIRIWYGVVLLDVVKLLHCHRSLGVGLYDVAMLIADDFGIDSLTNTLLVLTIVTVLTGIEDDDRERS